MASILPARPLRPPRASRLHATAKHGPCEFLALPLTGTHMHEASITATYRVARKLCRRVGCQAMRCGAHFVAFERMQQVSVNRVVHEDTVAHASYHLRAIYSSMHIYRELTVQAFVHSPALSASSGIRAQVGGS